MGEREELVRQWGLSVFKLPLPPLLAVFRFSVSLGRTSSSHSVRSIICSLIYDELTNNDLTSELILERHIIQQDYKSILIHNKHMHTITLCTSIS